MEVQVLSAAPLEKTKGITIKKANALQIIYIPGLGDARVAGQKMAISLWRYYGAQPHIFQMSWASDDESYDVKFSRLLELADKLSQTGPVGVVGVSAGATAAIQLFAARTNKIRGVVCIAGKINYPEAVSEYHKTANPTFWQGVHKVNPALAKLSKKDRGHILSIRGRVDRLVPARDSTLMYAHNRVTLTHGHPVTIAVQLLFGAPRFLRFLKQQ